MMVNIKDFFLHVFDELMDPESEMFMYNESKTLAWFPPKVRQFTDTEYRQFSTVWNVNIAIQICF